MIGCQRIAHDVFPLVEKWGAAAITLHGRSREQRCDSSYSPIQFSPILLLESISRYTKLADWEYIGECSRTVNVPGN